MPVKRPEEVFGLPSRTDLTQLGRIHGRHHCHQQWLHDWARSVTFKLAVPIHSASTSLLRIDAWENPYNTFPFYKISGWVVFASLEWMRVEISEAGLLSDKKQVIKKQLIRYNLVAYFNCSFIAWLTLKDWLTIIYLLRNTFRPIFDFILKTILLINVVSLVVYLLPLK